MRLCLSFVLVLAGFGLSAAAPLPAAMSPSTLLTQMRAACGGKAWSKVRGWHETGRVDLPGRPGLPYESWSDMRSLKSATLSRVEGRIVRHVGFDGRTSWQVRPDGRVASASDEAVLRRSRRDTYLSSFGYFYPRRFPAEFRLAGVETRDGRTYDVLRVTPRNAESMDFWVDRATHRIGRIVAGQEYAELGGYRTFSGVCTPTTGRQGDGDPAHAITLHVETVETGPVADSVFSPPSIPGP
jgi:hypothetical protein